MAFSTNNPLFGGAKATQPSGGIFGQSSQPTSIFGQSTQQQPTGSIFGQSTQQQPGSGIFGQLTQPQQQQQTGGLFGQSAQQQPSGGLFGQPTQQQQPTTSPFGQPTQQHQQQLSGGLFGQTAQPASGGIFGQATTQQQSNQPQGGSIFGSTTGQQQGGLFTSTAQQPQQPATGLFGSTLQPQAATSTGGFGSMTGGTSLFGTQPQPQPSVGASATSPFVLSRTTKFNDLPDDVKRILEGIDSFIQGRVQIGKESKQRKLGDDSKKVSELIRSVQKDLANSTTLIHNDLRLAKDLRGKVEQAVQDTIIATRIVDGFKNPQHCGTYLKDHAGFPLEFFIRIAENIKQRLVWYKSTIEQIERKLTSSAQHMPTPQSIGATLQAQNATFLALAHKTAALDAELQKIKGLYTQLWRAKTGSMRDPFNQLDRTGDEDDFGMTGLNVNK